MISTEACGTIIFVQIKMNTFVRFIQRRTIQKLNWIKCGQKVSVKLVGGKWGKHVIEYSPPLTRPTPILWILRSGLIGLLNCLLVPPPVTKVLKTLNKTWQGANSYCAQSWTGATLAILPNIHYQYFIGGLVRNVGRNAWIGGLRTTSDL